LFVFFPHAEFTFRVGVCSAFLKERIMQKMSGTLLVKVIKGSRGPFSVGDLATSIGDFKVKSAILDQFEEGTYAGDFLVTRIYPRSYFFKGRTVTEISADVSEVFLKDAEERALQREPDEPDPMDLDHQETVADKSAKPVAARPVKAEPAVRTAAVDDLALFGEDLHAFVAARTDVKLDATVDRTVFRHQRDRLKLLGYRFAPQTQTWSITQ
jgi:Protein of unknown function (DUF3275)